MDAQHLMIGDSYGMVRLREQVATAAPTNGRVLIFGENGTGKELVARNIHAMSRRRAGPFVEVNCAAIPEELIESELFGHVRGAFTGAVADRRGKFEVAHGGTIFLDEIGDMSLKTQAKVLRVLQEQAMEAVGGSTRSASTRECWPRPTRTCQPRFEPAGSARICTSGSTWCRFRAAAARARRGHPAAGRPLHGDARARYGRLPKTFEADAVARCSVTSGRATCASCET